ncbi:MAG: type IV pilus twitching motility protein PilT [Thermoanaerobaculia bacterium]|nr:type IV pilus twitching motility protein PilT [Thermoanaerobaculia bacterium]
MKRIDSFLKLVVEQDGSDLHLVSGNPPRVRIYGEVQPIKYRMLSAEETRELIFEIMPELARARFDAEGQVDFSYEVDGLARFRVNAFLHFRGIGAVVRVVPSKITSLDELALPPVVKNLCRRRNGFILVTGPTGSGKSTTLGAMVDLINEEREGHIITVEQPVELIHANKKCLVSQREVGSHARSFLDALRAAVREDPDVVVVGEMRDLETIRLAVTAAEMGTLVLGTLHTVGAIATVDRIINVFPAEEQAYIRSMVSTSLSGVISQALVRRGDGRGRVAAVEILINNAATSNLIREGRVDQLTNVIQAGGLQGMQTFDNALRRLVDERLITLEEAIRNARDPGQFQRSVRHKSEGS